MRDRDGDRRGPSVEKNGRALGQAVSRNTVTRGGAGGASGADGVTARDSGGRSALGAVSAAAVSAGRPGLLSIPRQTTTAATAPSAITTVTIFVAEDRRGSS